MSADEIWKDDILERQAEAQLLIGYIESISDRSAGRRDGNAQTISIDAGYGEGKTFFLRRLTKQLALDHPVAFVDAWADDLADDPLTAVASTLESALGGLLSKSAVKQKWKSVLKATGEVAKIAAIGAVKRGLGLAITSAAVEAASAAALASNQPLQEIAKDEAKSAGKDVVSGAEATLRDIAPDKLMQDRISAFKAGRAAVERLKEALANLVASLDGTQQQPPIVIVVDELDRCRPNYAIKLLEEIKHLFEVPGVVFIFGMHTEQLAHSVRAAYGPDFDGKSYLSRFIGRQYRLRTPNKALLVKQLLDASGVAPSKLLFPNVETGPGDANLPPDQVIARYVGAYGVAARDVFRLMDLLQTCAALTGPAPLLAPYILPLAIGKLRGVSGLPKPSLSSGGGRYVYHDREGRRQIEEFAKFAETMQSISRSPLEELTGNRSSSVHYRLVADAELNEHGGRLAKPRNYPELIETVGRFADPQLPASEAEEA